jgi:hypothetical protein
MVEGIQVEDDQLCPVGSMFEKVRGIEDGCHEEHKVEYNGHDLSKIPKIYR